MVRCDLEHVSGIVGRVLIYACHTLIGMEFTVASKAAAILVEEAVTWVSSETDFKLLLWFLFREGFHSVGLDWSLHTAGL